MRIAYVDMALGGGEIHVAEAPAGVLYTGLRIELAGGFWEVRGLLLCGASGVTSAIDGLPVDAVARVRRSTAFGLG